MTYHLEQLAAPGVDEDLLRQQLRHLSSRRSHFRRLWSYYTNPMLPRTLSQRSGNCERPYAQAQEWGMPMRITGYTPGRCAAEAQKVEDVARKEVVVENDIGWRIDTMIDYAFGRPPRFASLARTPAHREPSRRLHTAIFARSGGPGFFQQLGLLAAVYGFVDVLVTLDEAKARHLHRRLGAMSQPATADTEPSAAAVPPAGNDADAPGDPHARPAAAGKALPPHAQDELLEDLAACIRLEVVHPENALPLMVDDHQRPAAFGHAWRLHPRDAAPEPGQPRRSSWLRRLLAGPAHLLDHETGEPQALQLFSADAWQQYERGQLVAGGRNALGELPLVHIQNLAVPFEYAGPSDVEPLIPLQDELNTRLSDRGYRIAMQSFKMFLGKGIDNFGQLKIGPGQMWMTDNERASIVEFGGDTASPGETQHIPEIREALDKASGVNAVAAGAIKERVGNLTSAAALRVTMLALVIRTQRKRAAFDTAIEQMSRLALKWLDRAGLLKAVGLGGLADGHKLEVHWPNPIPVSGMEQLQEAREKLALGVPRQTVLQELGYELPPEAAATPPADAIDDPLPF